MHARGSRLRLVLGTLWVCLLVAFAPSSAWASASSTSAPVDDASVTTSPAAEPDPEPTPDPEPEPTPEPVAGEVSLTDDQWGEIRLAAGALVFFAALQSVASFGWGGRRG